MSNHEMITIITYVQNGCHKEKDLCSFSRGKKKDSLLLVFPLGAILGWSMLERRYTCPGTFWPSLGCLVPPGRSDLGAGHRRVGERARALSAAKEDRCRDNVGRHNGICQGGFFGSDSNGGQRKRKYAVKTGRLRNSYPGSH